MLGSNLLRHWQGLEKQIKDCALTKKEQAPFTFTKTIVAICVCFSFKSEEKFVF